MATVAAQEVATLRTDPHVPLFQQALVPTDETLRARGAGKGHAVYDEIRRDPHAHAVLQKRKLEITAREWEVRPATESRIDKKAADEVQRQMKALNFDRITGGLLGAILKGFAVAEVIWANVDGIWTVTAVKVKKQRRFKFDMDGKLMMLTRQSPSNGEDVPARKFIVHRYSIEDDDDDPYGVGLGSVLFWPAWFKRQVLAHWLRGAEKNAGPTRHVTYEGAYDKAMTEQLVNDFMNSTSDSVVATPSNVTVQLLEAKAGASGDVFEKLSRYLDELMSEAVLGETLTTNSGERGARSLGEIHNDVRLAIAKADADLLSQTFRETLFRWIVEVNFPGAGIPELWRNFEESEDLNEKIKRDETLDRLGYEPEDEDYYSETYGGSWVKKPEPKPEDDPAVEQPGQPGKKQTDTLFDDRPASESDQVAEALGSQLEELAAPAVDEMIAATRAEVMAAVSYEDLVERLARLSGELGIDDLASLMEDAGTVAQLQGVASVKDEVDG